MKALPLVYVVDDCDDVRKSLCAVVNSLNLPVIGFASAEQFLASLDRTRPGCLLVDYRLPGMNGLELQERLRAENCSLPVILITAHGDMPLAVRAMRNGAVTALEKPCDDVRLIEAIREAIAPEQSKLRIDERHEQTKNRFTGLTERERAVLEMMLSGKLNKNIATTLGISLRTVESRRHNIFQKTGTSSLPELVQLAVAAGLGTDEST
jgi:FixJ family two-component response regulator